MRRIAGIALVAVLALVVAGAFGGCGCQKQAVQATSGNIDKAKDAVSKVNLLTIKTGIQAAIATTSALPPDASPATLGGVVNPWPRNPFTNQAMQQGDGVGDYVYTPGAGTAYTLAVHLSDGGTYTAP